MLLDDVCDIWWYFRYATSYINFITWSNNSILCTGISKIQMRFGLLFACEWIMQFWWKLGLNWTLNHIELYHGEIWFFEELCWEEIWQLIIIYIKSKKWAIYRWAIYATEFNLWGILDRFLEPNNFFPVRLFWAKLFLVV